MEDCIGQGFQKMNVVNAKVIDTILIKEVIIADVKKYSNK